MPVHFAGWVNANASVRWGSGFTVSRVGLLYRVAMPSTRPILAVVSPIGTNRVARVAQSVWDSVNGIAVVDIEIRDMNSGAVIDGGFNFIALQDS
jgi:hypothetical protein